MRSKFITPKKDILLLNEEKVARVIGIDEVGRGCWAGPVVVGGFVFDNKGYVKGVHDSKLLKKELREKASKKLQKYDYKIEIGDLETIDKIGIGKTIEGLMAKIVEYYRNKFGSLDTIFVIDGTFARNFGKDTKKVIKADSNYYSVASASVLAKVFRDSMMVNLHQNYPNYSFNINKGYATKKHRMAISELGICELHRKSFKPVYLQYLKDNQQMLDLNS